MVEMVNYTVYWRSCLYYCKWKSSGLFRQRRSELALNFTIFLHIILQNMTSTGNCAKPCATNCWNCWLIRYLCLFLFLQIEIHCSILRIASNSLCIPDVSIWSLLTRFLFSLSSIILELWISSSRWLRNSISFSINILCHMYWWHRDRFTQLNILLWIFQTHVWLI